MQNPSQTYPIILVALSSILGACAQFFYKRGGVKVNHTPIWAIPEIYIGLVLFTAVFVLFILAFKSGGRLTVVYPIYALTFIWSAFLGHYIENESLNLKMLAGILAIIIGVTLIAFGKTEA